MIPPLQPDFILTAVSFFERGRGVLLDSLDEKIT